jgi:hypothetical protein
LSEPPGAADAGPADPAPDRDPDPDADPDGDPDADPDSAASVAVVWTGGVLARRRDFLGESVFAMFPSVALSNIA